MGKEDFISPWAVRKKPPVPFTEKEDTSATGWYEYWKLKRKLKPWIEVEWGVGSWLVKVGSGTRSTTWTMAITGVGFKPTSVEIVAAYVWGGGSYSEGSSDWTSEFSVSWFPNPTTPAVEFYSRLISVNWTRTWTTVANLLSFDADGFTLNFTSIWPSIEFYYVCRK